MDGQRVKDARIGLGFVGVWRFSRGFFFEV